MVAEGPSNAEIVARLCLSAATVQNHIVRILAKLGLQDRVQVGTSNRHGRSSKRSCVMTDVGIRVQVHGGSTTGI